MAEIIVNPAEATTPISVVCGNANAEVIRFTFPRNSEGVDLGECTWAVTAKNSGGFSDTYMQGHGMSAPTVTNDSISVKWTLSGVAVGTAGRTIYQLIGIQGKAIIKQFPYHTINVLSYLESSLSTEAEEDMSALWEAIDYVGNELPEILEAEADREVAEAARASAETARGTAEDARAETEEEREVAETARATAETARAAAEAARAEAEEEREAAETARATAETARAAAEAARAEAEEERAEDFAKIDLYTSKTGKITTVTAVNAQGETTQSEVKDGEDGTGLVIKALYATLEALQQDHPTGTLGDVYAIGTSDDNEVYIWDTKTSSYKSLGALQGPAGPQGPQGAPGVQGPVGPAGQDGADGQDAPQESILYTEQTLTDAQKTQARTNIGAAASDHTQAASTITAGTFAGQTNANANAAATLGTAQVRDIVITTTDLTAGSSALTTGRVYLVYE